VHEDQFVPVYGEGVPAVIQDQLDGLDWVVQNTRTWGAWLEMHVQDGELHVYNGGWGRAVNVTLEYGGGTETIPVLEPGDMHQVPLAAGPATVTYRQLLIDAPEAKTRVVTFDPGVAAEGPEPVAEAPGVPVAVLLAVVAALAVLRRRA